MIVAACNFSVLLSAYLGSVNYALIRTENSERKMSKENKQNSE